MDLDPSLMEQKGVAVRCYMVYEELVNDNRGSGKYADSKVETEN